MAAERTLYVEIRHHVTELLNVFGQMRSTSNVLETSEAIATEACSDAGELMDCAQLRELAACQSEVADGLSCVGWRPRWGLERLLREVVTAIDVDELLRIGLDVI